MKAIFKGKTMPDGEITLDLDHWSAGTIAAHFLVTTLPLGENHYFSVEKFNNTAWVCIQRDRICKVTRIPD